MAVKQDSIWTKLTGSVKPVITIVPNAKTQQPSAQSVRLEANSLLQAHVFVWTSTGIMLALASHAIQLVEPVTGPERISVLLVKQMQLSRAISHAYVILASMDRLRLVSLATRLVRSVLQQMTHLNARSVMQTRQVEP